MSQRRIIYFVDIISGSDSLIDDSNSMVGDDNFAKLFASLLEEAETLLGVTSESNVLP